MSNTKSPSFLLKQKFPFEPTPSQNELFKKLDKFISNKDEWEALTFVLKGYAGTGKTTVISTLINILRNFGYKYVLLAPTGRAAKVMANYSKKKALTIHKRIYKQKNNPHSGTLAFERMNNYSMSTIFIVDESSMISDESEFGSNSLLTDLVEYVFTHPSNGHNGNKLIFVGDTAQLPPVGSNESPALQPEYLAQAFHFEVDSHEMVDVMRQGLESGILFNATSLRKLIQNEQINLSFLTKGFKDFYRMTSEKLEDGLNYAYNKYGKENVIILTRSNKNAVMYNRYIRQTILFNEDEISTGDLLMIVRNNYFWLDEESPAGFLANGDFFEIVRTLREEEMHGLRFLNIEIRLIDYDDIPPFEVKIILDTLYSNTPALSLEQNKALFESVGKDYEYIPNKRQRMEAIKKDPYLNALQVKFAYCLTTHKAQGGQWPCVFVDQGYLKDEQIDKEFIRWLYTAITRSSHELFLVNFNDKFFLN
ncbi:MAG: hypothetical protein RIR51_1099 [Bacteroidota bacterium]